MINIALQSVCKSFGDVRAVDDVTLSIGRGEMFFLLGPSGCGKTTLLRIIAGLESPDAGALFFDGEDVTRAPSQKRNAVMVFQSYALWPHMTVEENVAFGLRVRRVARPDRRSRILEALRLVQLEKLVRRKPGQLSGGQQQRVALARALVVRPSCLLLDEPLSNLDAVLRLEMRSELRRLCKELDLTTICVTHDQKEALSMGDRIAVMDNGVVEQVGSPMEIYSRPKNIEVASFIGTTNALDGVISSAQEQLRVCDTALGKLHVHAAPDTPTSGRCSVCFRPEAIRVASNSESPNRFHAVLLDRVFNGDALELSLAVGDIKLLATMLERPSSVKLADACELSCYVDPRDIVLLKK